jgi:hypothetical protein
MDSDKIWKVVERACTIAGLLFTAATLYYTAATYYGWNQSPTPTALWWPFVQGGLGVALLVTAWTMLRARNSANQQNKESLVTKRNIETLGSTADIAVFFKTGSPYETTEITNGRGLSTVKIGLKR